MTFPDPPAAPACTCFKMRPPSGASPRLAGQRMATASRRARHHGELAHAEPA